MAYPECLHSAPSSETHNYIKYRVITPADCLKCKFLCITLLVLITCGQGRTIAMGQKGQCPPPLCNFFLRLPHPGNFLICPLLTICLIFFTGLVFIIIQTNIVDIYKSTKSRKVCHVRSISELFLVHFSFFFQNTGQQSK